MIADPRLDSTSLTTGREDDEIVREDDEFVREDDEIVHEDDEFGRQDDEKYRGVLGAGPLGVGVAK
jgi:hypothetical protein